MLTEFHATSFSSLAISRHLGSTRRIASGVAFSKEVVALLDEDDGRRRQDQAQYVVSKSAEDRHLLESLDPVVLHVTISGSRSRRHRSAANDRVSRRSRIAGQSYSHNRSLS